MTIEEKKQCIQPEHLDLSIDRQCELIGLSRSSYYREGPAGQETPENLEIMNCIDLEYTDHPFYGTRQMRNVLRRRGYTINRGSFQNSVSRFGPQNLPQRQRK
jgi:putative transposase